MNRFILLLLAGALFVSPVVMTGTAQATLIGDTVRWEHIFDGRLITTQTAVVGSGVEFNIQQTRIDIDISASSIRFDVSGGIGFTFRPHQYKVTDLDWVAQSGSITGINVSFGGPIVLNSFGTSQGLSAFSASNATFGSDFIELDIGGYGFSTGSFVQIDLVTEHTPGPTVPEPGTMLLFGSGLAGLAAWRYKKQKTA